MYLKLEIIFYLLYYVKGVFMKKFINLLVFLMFLTLFFSFNSFATHKHVESISDTCFEYSENGVKTTYMPYSKKGKVSPLAVDACPGRGNHTMISNGWGTLIEVNKYGKKKTIFSAGCTWQCKYCNEVLLTQYDPLRTKKTGYYSMRNPGYQLSSSVFIMEASPNNISYTSGSRVPYCNLFYR